MRRRCYMNYIFPEYTKVQRLLRAIMYYSRILACYQGWM
ncbi:hypothetical protein V6Z11_D08G084200 [Gossypium hirsutum]